MADAIDNEEYDYTGIPKVETEEYDYTGIPARQPDTEITFSDMTYMTTGLSEENFRRLEQERKGQPNAPDLGVWDLIEKGYNASVAGAMHQAVQPEPNAALIEATPDEIQKLPVQFRSLSAEEYASLPAWKRQVMGGTTLLLDFPVMLGGFALGAGMGIPAGPWAIVAGTAGAFALPAGLRKVYVDRIRNGEVESWAEFWDRLSGGVTDAGKSWLVGASTGAVGVAMGPAAAPIVTGTTKVLGPTAGPATGEFVAAVARLAAEGSTMVTVGAALEGRVPEPWEFMDAAITLGALKLAVKAGSKGVSVVREHVSKVNEEAAYSTRDKLLRIYEETGIAPKDIIELAAKDPKFLEEFMSDTSEMPPIIMEKIKSKELTDTRQANEAKLGELSKAIETKVNELDAARKALMGAKTESEANAFGLEIFQKQRELDLLTQKYNEQVGKTSKLTVSSKDVETNLLDIENKIAEQTRIRDKNKADIDTSLMLGDQETVAKASEKADVADAKIMELEKQAGYLRGQKERLGALPEETELSDYGRRLAKMAKDTLGMDVLEPTDSVREMMERHSKPEPDNWWQWTKEHLTKTKNIMTRQFEHLPRGEYGDLKFKLTHWLNGRDIINKKVAGLLKYITEGLNKSSYKLFNYRVVLDDMIADYKQRLEARNPGDTTKPKLPEGRTIEEVLVESEKINAEIAKSPHRDRIEKALVERNAFWNRLKEDYIEALREIGIDVSDKYVLGNYFKKQMVEYTKEFSKYNRKQRQPGENTYYTDYLYVESSIISQMLRDIETANLIKFLKKEYSDPRRAEMERAAKEKGGKWQDYANDKEELWQPKKGGLFYVSESMVDKSLGEMLKTILKVDDAALEKMMESPVVKEVVGGYESKDALRVRGSKEEYVLPKEIVETLNKLATPEMKGGIKWLTSGLISNWKKWVLFGPNVAKYILRNLTGDLDITIAGNPRILFHPEGWVKLVKATKELSQYYLTDGKDVAKGKLSDLAEWIDRGGGISTLQAQEKIGQLNALKDAMTKFDPIGGVTEVAKLGWKKYWQSIRMFNDLRESVLRYANYLDYRDSIANDIKNGGRGVPHNFGASNKKDIMQIADPKDRAYALANDLIGSYDRITEGGQALRAYAYPFWSFKEINMRRYYNLMRNAVTVPEFVERSAENFKEKMISRGINVAKLTPLAMYRIGTTLLKIHALTMAASLFNHQNFPDEEKALPEDVRNRPHIILGKDEDGNPIYFTRIGAIGDLYDWFGASSAPDLAVQLIRGEITKDEFIDKYAAKHLPYGKVDVSAANASLKAAEAAKDVVINDTFPLIKLAYGTIEKYEFYPELKKSRETSRIGVLAKNLQLYNAYKNVANLFTEDKYPMKEQSWGDFFIKQVAYKSDTYESAYFSIRSKKDKYLADLGKEGFNTRFDPKTQYLYNAKVALRFGDEKLAQHYINKYALSGGTNEGFKRSLESMFPLYGLSKEEIPGFLASLSRDDLIRLDMAFIYYGSLLGGSPKKQEK